MKPNEILGLIEEAAGTRMFGAGRLATTIDCGHPVQLGVGGACVDVQCGDSVWVAVQCVGRPPSTAVGHRLLKGAVSMCRGVYST